MMEVWKFGERFGETPKSSERAIKSSETGSETHPHKFLDKPSGKDEHGSIPKTRNRRKHIIPDLSVIFARILQESHLKMD